MTERELKIFNRIPKRVKRHVVNLSMEKSGNYNDRGQELYRYTVTWDNGEEHEFENQKMMLWLLNYYADDDGYYVDG